MTIRHHHDLIPTPEAELVGYEVSTSGRNQYYEYTLRLAECPICEGPYDAVDKDVIVRALKESINQLDTGGVPVEMRFEHLQLESVEHIEGCESDCECKCKYDLYYRVDTEKV